MKQLLFAALTLISINSFAEDAIPVTAEAAQPAVQEKSIAEQKASVEQLVSIEEKSFFDTRTVEDVQQMIQASLEIEK